MATLSIMLPVNYNGERPVRKPYKMANLNVRVKGAGTRDFIWLKVVSLDRSWLAGLTDDL